MIRSAPVPDVWACSRRTPPSPRPEQVDRGLQNPQAGPAGPRARSDQESPDHQQDEPEPAPPGHGEETLADRHGIDQEEKTQQHCGARHQTPLSSAPRSSAGRCRP